MREEKVSSRGPEGEGITACDRAFQLFFEKAETIEGLENQDISTLRSLVKTSKMPQLEKIIELLTPKENLDAEN
jgi:hypothetical protein